LDRANGAYCARVPRTRSRSEARAVKNIRSVGRLSGGRALTLRPANASDVEFALRVERETMREYATATWGSWLEDQARSRTVKNVLAGQTQIVEFGGVPVGTEVVERTAEHIRLLQLFILPEHQRQGIGSELVERLIQEGRNTGLPLKLRVLRVNPAQLLYKRLGFTVVDTTTEHVYMQYAI
jgi:GNAT superfamily N-acetyltransferase